MRKDFFGIKILLRGCVLAVCWAANVLARLAVAGGGITRLAAFVANPYIAAGQLEQLFVPDQRSDVIAEVEPLDFYLCVRDRYQLTPKVRAFMDFLVTALPAERRVVQ